MPTLLIGFILAALSGTAIAQEAPTQEVWLCKGVYQTTPGEPVKPQERTLVLILATGKAVMKVEGNEHQGRFEASGQHVAAWFDVTPSGAESLLDEATLVRVTGRLSVNTQRRDGSRAGVYRGGCRPAEAGGG